VQVCFICFDADYSKICFGMVKIFLKVANDPSEESFEPIVELEQGNGAFLFIKIFCCGLLFECQIMGMPLDILLRVSHVVCFIN
jgi:hypothetical protein